MDPNARSSTQSETDTESKLKAWGTEHEVQDFSGGGAVGWVRRYR